MRKGLAVIGILLVLLGSFLVLHSDHAKSGCSSEYSEVRLSFARALEVQNGGEVEAYVLAVDAPVNASRIRVVNDPDGVSYVFKKRNGLFYPPKPLSFKNLYVENLSWRARIIIYAASGDYAGFLNVSKGKFTVSASVKDFGGIAFLCNRGFLLNVSAPRGTVYGDDGTAILVLKNDSFRILNEAYHGTPLSLQMGCSPNQGKIGYTLLYRNPFGGYIYHSAVWKGLGVVLARGFSFREMEAYQNVTPCGSRASSGGRAFYMKSSLWGVVMIALGVLLILAAVRISYKWEGRHLKR